MEKYDINSQDYVVNTMFNSDGTRKEKKPEDLSLGKKPIKNERRKKQKAKGTKDIAKKIIVLAALGIGLASGIHELNQGINVTKLSNELDSTFDNIIEENIKYPSYDVNREAYNWYYDYDGIIKGIKEQGLDIHTSIYEAYINLNEYDRVASINTIMRKLGVDMDFPDYLNSIGFSYEDLSKWGDYMEKVKHAYASKDLQTGELEELLEGLNNPNLGGSR